MKKLMVFFANFFSGQKLERASMHCKINLLNNLMKAMTVTLLISLSLSSVGYSQEKDVNILIRKLTDKDADVRLSAAGALAEIKDARAVAPLIAALKDKDRGVRMNAALALGEIKDARAVEPLILAFKDKDTFVRSKVAVALGKTQDARALGPLIAALKAMFSQRSSEFSNRFCIDSEKFWRNPQSA